MSAESIPSPWRNRITRYADVEPVSLVAHPMNWRAHPENQRAALSGSLDEIGWIAPVIVSESTGRIIDGHLRVALAIAHEEPTVPVGYVELTEREEKLALLALDPIASLAEANKAALDMLMREAVPSDARFQNMIADLAAKVGIIAPDFAASDADSQSDLDDRVPIVCPKCGHEFYA
jgi:ParB-like chromosome segregation protein Spo0J